MNVDFQVYVKLIKQANKTTIFGALLTVNQLQQANSVA
jgi:hypothetical protein